MAEVHYAIFLSSPALFKAASAFGRIAIMSDLQSSEKDWLFTNLQVAESHNENFFSIFLLLKLKISYEPEFKSLFSFLVLRLFRRSCVSNDCCANRRQVPGAFGFAP